MVWIAARRTWLPCGPSLQLLAVGAPYGAGFKHPSAESEVAVNAKSEHYWLGADCAQRAGTFAKLGWSGRLPRPERTPPRRHPCARSEATQPQVQ